MIAIKIANQTNAESDVVEIVAVDMAAVDLPAPPIAYFDLAVTGRGAVADDKMIGQAVFHSSNPAVVVIKNARISLTRPAIVHNDKFPAITHDRRAANLFDHRPREIAIPLRTRA